MGTREESALHLLVVVTNFAETRGGVEGHLKALLPRLSARGVKVTVAYLGDGRPQRTDDGVRVVSIPRWLDFREVIAVPDPRAWRRFESVVRRGELPGGPVTHVATHTRFFPMSYLGMRLGHRGGIPVLHTEHGGGFVATSSRAVEGVSRAVDLTMGKAVLGGATRVLAVSSASCDFVQRLAGVQAQQFNNGVDIRRWLPDPSSTPPASRDERALVFVGRVVAEKGWRPFLDIARTCRDRGWRGEVHLLGAGKDHTVAIRDAVTLGLEPFHAPGHVGSDAVRDALHGGVYVNPTLASEGLQLTLVEALAAGAAVASYTVGGTSEIAQIPGASVRVVPQRDVAALGEAAWSLLNEPAPEPSFEQLKEWDWDIIAERYVAILAELGRRPVTSDEPHGRLD